MLDPLKLNDLKILMKECMQNDVALMDELRDEVEVLKNGVKKINPRTSTAISLVGTDGGNNNLEFDPFIVHVIRVVDSNGVEYYMDVITPTTPISKIDNKIKDGNNKGYNSLRQMMDALNVESISKLSPMIRERKRGEPVKTSWIQAYRELVEWATLFSLIKNKNYGSDTIIVFDGLLRSKVFSGDLFHKLKNELQRLIEERYTTTGCKIYIVGVAKHSKVLDRYRLVMHTDGIMKTKYPCYAEVPRLMEEKSYIWAEYARDDDYAGAEVNKYVAGKMFFVKFGDQKDDPIWPVDILTSQLRDSDKIISYLMNDAIYGFPIPWYPLCLQKAHENSALFDFDMDLIRDSMTNAIREAMGEEKENFDSFLFANSDTTGRRYG